MKLFLSRTPQADEDALEMYQHIGRDHPVAASEYFDALFDLFDTLLDHPKIGTRFEQATGELSGVRFIPVSAKFEKHLVFYIPGDNAIRVIRILHSSRDIETLFLDE